MKFVKEISGLSWTLAGTGLVLITLSGNTRRLGIVDISTCVVDVSMGTEVVVA